MEQDPHKLAEKTDTELAVWISGWKPGSEWHWQGLMEIERRKDKKNGLRSWLSIGISIVSLIVAITALYLHANP